MPELPEGTVSFLFTDVEGSTAALKALRERYAGVLLDEEAVQRASFEAHDGMVVDMQGDAFFVCFRRAHDAVAAAVEAQRELAQRRWPEGVALDVRMGIHTGEPQRQNGRYFGIDVHRAARIASAAHGGQVLLSDATRDLVEQDLPEGVGLRNLGVHKLKGLDRPEQVHQLVAPGLAQTFPPLETADSDGRHRRRTRLRLLLAAGVVGVVAAGVTVPLLIHQQSGIDRIEGNAVGILDAARGGIDHAQTVGSPPGAAAAGEHAVWLITPGDGTASRIDPESGASEQTLKVGRDASAVAVGDGAAWVTSSSDGTVSRIDLKTNQPVQKIPVGNAPAALAYSGGRLWVTSAAESWLKEIDTRTGRVAGVIALPAPGKAIATGFGAVWVSHGGTGTVSQIDARTKRVVATVASGGGAGAIAAGPTAVWVANELDGTVTRLDPRTGVVQATIPVGRGPSGVAVAGEKVWVTNGLSGTLVRIDAGSTGGVVDRTVRLGGSPQAIAVVDGSLVVPVRPLAGRRGGTLRAYMASLFLSSPRDLDPALSYTGGAWDLISVVGDGLVAYKRTGGPDASMLVPDLALALPSATDGATVYRFQLRQGLRYSNGRPVKASDVRASLERVFRLHSPAVAYYTGIVGGQACVHKPHACNLAGGIVTDDHVGSVTFHLTAPDPDFLHKLTMPFAFVLPAGSSNRPAAGYPAPSTGPYLVGEVRPGRLVRLVRNPHFRVWSPAAKPDGYPDQILVTLVPPTPAAARRALEAVKQGKADIIDRFLINAAHGLRELRLRYPSRLNRPPAPGIGFLALNTKLPPFDSLDARRAVSYAVDRSFVRANGDRPSCQVLPPALAGYRPYCPYTLHPATGRWSAPDLVTARRLVARSGTRGAHVTIWAGASSRVVTDPFVKALRRIGYRVSVRTLPDAVYPAKIVDPQLARRVQAARYAWLADYLSPAGYMTALFHCGAPTTAVYSCTTWLDRAIERATAAQVAGSTDSTGRWTAIDRRIVDQALIVPVAVAGDPSFVSARVGNLQYHPAYRVLYDQAWVR